MDHTYPGLDEKKFQGEYCINFNCCLVKKNHLCSYIITVQESPFENYPISISIEDHIFALTLVIKGTFIGVGTGYQPTNISKLSHILSYHQNTNGIHRAFTSQSNCALCMWIFQGKLGTLRHNEKILIYWENTAMVQRINPYMTSAS